MHSCLALGGSSHNSCSDWKNWTRVASLRQLQKGEQTYRPETALHALNVRTDRLMLQAKRAGYREAPVREQIVGGCAPDRAVTASRQWMRVVVKATAHLLLVFLFCTALVRQGLHELLSRYSCLLHTSERFSVNQALLGNFIMHRTSFHQLQCELTLSPFSQKDAKTRPQNTTHKRIAGCQRTTSDDWAPVVFL